MLARPTENSFGLVCYLAYHFSVSASSALYFSRCTERQFVASSILVQSHVNFECKYILAHCEADGQIYTVSHEPDPCYVLK